MKSPTPLWTQELYVPQQRSLPIDGLGRQEVPNGNRRSTPRGRQRRRLNLTKSLFTIKSARSLIFDEPLINASVGVCEVLKRGERVQQIFQRPGLGTRSAPLNQSIAPPLTHHVAASVSSGGAAESVSVAVDPSGSILRSIASGFDGSSPCEPSAPRVRSRLVSCIRLSSSPLHKTP